MALTAENLPAQCHTVVLKVVLGTGASFSCITMDQFLCVSRFSHPLAVPAQWMCAIQKVLETYEDGYVRVGIMFGCVQIYLFYTVNNKKGLRRDSG